ncbi:hypothetical protein [Salinicola sp. NYA28a]|jgi:hypothetical protein
MSWSSKTPGVVRQPEIESIRMEPEVNRVFRSIATAGGRKLYLTQDTHNQLDIIDLERSYPSIFADREFSDSMSPDNAVQTPQWWWFYPGRFPLAKREWDEVNSKIDDR